MKKIQALLPIIFLAGCMTTQGAQTECNTQHTVSGIPNFYMKINKDTYEQEISCLRDKQVPLIPMRLGDNDKMNALIDYQISLWRQIMAKDITPKRATDLYFNEKSSLERNSENSYFYQPQSFTKPNAVKAPNYIPDNRSISTNCNSNGLGGFNCTSRKTGLDPSIPLQINQ
jgi:hypothetical protein